MLKEVGKSRQIPGQGTRRWFSDSRLDLFVWEDSKGNIDGFQLCYGKGKDEHAFTWRKSGRCTHHRVDDGEYPGLDYKSSPILVPDGFVDMPALLDEFRARSTGIDPALSGFVRRKLTGWQAGRPGPR
jgi:hypothetical protein